MTTRPLSRGRASCASNTRWGRISLAAMAASVALTVAVAVAADGIVALALIAVLAWLRAAAPRAPAD